MSAPVTESHKRLVATIVERAFRFAEGNHKITPELSQLIADSEARATAPLRARISSDEELFHEIRMKLTAACGDPYKLHDEALDAIIAERDQLRAELADEKNLHAQTRTVVEELNTICTDLRNAGGPPFIRSEAIRLLREDQATLRAEVERLNADRDDWKAKHWKAHDDFHRQFVEMQALTARAERAEAELATEREKVRVLKLDKDRLDWWNGESYYQFGKNHKCMNPGWWWSCGFQQIQGKSGIKNIRDAIDSAMAHSKSGRNKYNVCKRIEKSETEGTK